MSMIRCDRCDRYIDSDDDPDCFVERPNYTNTAHPVNPAYAEKIEWDVLCEPCRDEQWDEEQREMGP